MGLKQFTTEPSEAKTYHPTRVIKIAAILMVLSNTQMINGFSIPDSDFSRGVIGFLRSLETTIEKKTALFYRHFGKNVDPAKINQVSKCDYTDPVKMKFCGPKFNLRNKNPNLPERVTVHNNPLLKNNSSMASIPSDCLDDPHLPGCQEFRSLIDNDTPLPGIGAFKGNGRVKLGVDGKSESSPTEAPSDTDIAFLTATPSPPIGAIVSFSPTRFMCYGNHDSFKQAAERGDEMTNVRGKWCESSMPSVSMEPSGSPVLFPRGSQRDVSDPTPRPTPKPTAIIISDPPIYSRRPNMPSMPTTLEPVNPPLAPPVFPPIHTRMPNTPPTLEPVAPPFNPPISPPVQPPVLPPLYLTSVPSLAPFGIPSGPPNQPTIRPVQQPTMHPLQLPTLQPVRYEISQQPTGVASSQPSQIPSIRPSVEKSLSPSSLSPSPSKNPTVTPTATPTGSPTTVPSESNLKPPSAQPTGSPSVAPSPSKDPDSTPSVWPTENPTRAPSETRTENPTSEQTGAPSEGPSTFTNSPSGSPTAIPSRIVTEFPTSNPTASPSSTPSDHISESPTQMPTGAPSEVPSTSPKESPTDNPVGSPTDIPTDIRTKAPTVSPSKAPSEDKTDTPSIRLTETPSATPTSSSSPIGTYPTNVPSQKGTETPTSNPTESPSEKGRSDSPTSMPTRAQSVVPSSSSPNTIPTDAPVPSPTDNPSRIGTKVPTTGPTVSPSDHPSQTKTNPPSEIETKQPTSQPSVSNSNSPSESKSEPPSESQTESPTGVSSPSQSPTEMQSNGPIESPTETPSDVNTPLPTSKPSVRYSTVPTDRPSQSPFTIPSASPTVSNSNSPSDEVPVPSPTDSPSRIGTKVPTTGPTVSPSDHPSQTKTNPPSEIETKQPTSQPSVSNSNSPSESKSESPSERQTESPTGVSSPSQSPTEMQSNGPIESPTETPSDVNTPLPTSKPSIRHSSSPTKRPSQSPFTTPTKSPTSTSSPSGTNSDMPSDSPRGLPTITPSKVETSIPTKRPSESPVPKPSNVPTTAPSAQSQSPTDCYDLHGITSDYMVDQVGSEIPIPEDSLKIVNGEGTSVTIELSQLWSADVDLNLFIHYHSDKHQSVCEAIPDFSYQESINKDLQCYDGWTDVGIFVYFDSDLSLDECEECRPPETDEEGVVAYHFELPCAPICGTNEPSQAPSIPLPKPSNVPTTAPSAQSQSPTDCYDLHGITSDYMVDQVGSEIPIPEDSLKIVNGEGTSVTIELSQLWSADVDLNLFIHYHSDKHQSVCEAIPDFSYQESINKDLQCYDGWTDVGIFVYFDSDLSLDECEECRPPETDEEGVVAYHFELPCAPICGTNEPSQAPSIPLPKPSNVPTTAPSAQSQSPTDCYDLHGITSDYMVDQVGSEIPIPEDSLKIVNGEGTSVTIELSQLWSADVDLNLFIHYHSDKHQSVCEAIPDFSYQESINKDLQCYDGWTDVGIFVYFDSDLSLDECEECRPPETDEEGVVAYHFELPCAPICGTNEPSQAPSIPLPKPSNVPTTAPSAQSQSPTDCYDLHGITSDYMVDQVGSEIPIPEDSLKIVNGEGTSVTIELSQLWSADVDLNLFIHYHSDKHQSVCEAIPDFSYQESINKDLQCYDGWTDVGIFVYFDSDLSLDECEECRPPETDEEGVVAYHFELPCAPICGTNEPSQAPSIPLPKPSNVPTTAPSAQSQSPTDCYDLHGITSDYMVDQVGSEIPIPEDSLKIVNGEGTSVTIELSQLWSADVDLNLFIHYHSDKHQSVCEAIPDFSYQESINKDLQCYDGWTDVGIFVYFDSDLSLDECEECRPPETDEEGVVAYHFELPCAPICGTNEPSQAPSIPLPKPSNVPTTAPSAQSQSPTDCYDLHGITSDYMVDQVGSEIPIPEDSLKIVNGEGTSVTIELSQLWSADVDLNLFIHYHSDKHQSVCEAIPDFSYQESINKDLQCYDGWTDVGIFVYFDSDLSLDECEECRPPETDEEGVVAYHFELPCAPICGTNEPSQAPSIPLPKPSNVPTTAPSAQSQSPTDCYDLHGITSDYMVDQVGSEIPIPEDSLKIVNGEGTSVTIELSQLWSADVDLNLFIHYHSDKHQSVCEAIPDFSYQESINKDLQCYDGWTDVGIFVYFDSDLSLDECEECRPPETDEEGVVAYHFELPCAPICGTNEPSQAPSIPLPKPSNVPTTAPSAQSQSPTDCYDLHGITSDYMVDQVGSEIPIPEDSLKIVNGEGTSVTIELSQLWSADVDLNLFIHYHSDKHQSVCEAIPDFSYQESINKDLQCYDGWTDVGIFVYFDSDLSLDECEECRPPETDEEGVVAYHFELPCAPICGTNEPSQAPSIPLPKPSNVPTTAPSAQSQSPTDCYDLHGITSDYMVDQVGSEIPIPEDSLKIVNGEGTSVTIELSQLWSADVDLNLFIHYHSDKHQSVCEAIPDFSYQESINKDLQCYDGWTDVGIFVYFDSDLSLDECEECRPPETDEEGVVAYHFELPCAPICGTNEPSQAPSIPLPKPSNVPTTAPSAQSQSPTDCYDLHGITSDYMVDQVGSEIPIPEDSLKIVNGEGTSVTIELSQLWSADVDLNLFIHYHSDKHQSVCEAIPDFSYQESINKDLQCYDGWTDVGIFVYFDSDLSLDECEECRPPETDEEGVVAYHFELPCAPICGTNEPSQAPSIPLPKPSNVPTTAPSAQSQSPPVSDLCVDTVEISVVEKSPNEIIFGPEIISITNLETSTVAFDLLINDFYDMVSVGYYAAFTNQRECLQELNVTVGATLPIVAACYDGYASVTVFMYAGDEFDVDSCEACSLPGIETEGYMAIDFEIPCVPVDCAPSSAPSEFPLDMAKCAHGIELVERDVGVSPVCEIASSPFIVEEFDNDNSGEVRVSFANSWSVAMQEIHLFYEGGDGTGKQRHSLELVEKGALFPNSFTLLCNPDTHTATVDVLVCDGFISHSSSGNACDGSYLGSCSYTFEVPCRTDIICEERASEGMLFVHGNSHTEQGFQTAEMKAAADPTEDEDDIPYCLHKDYPCEGDDENMVFVCHYSSRSNYQTYCIPQMDSDILRFNRNHHCGPCHGWNGTEYNDQLI